MERQRNETTSQASQNGVLVKSSFAVSVLRFVDIRSNTGSGSADLIGDDRFVLAFQEFYQVQDFNGKRYR